MPMNRGASLGSALSAVFRPVYPIDQFPYFVDRIDRTKPVHLLDARSCFATLYQGHTTSMVLACDGVLGANKASTDAAGTKTR